MSTWDFEGSTEKGLNQHVKVKVGYLLQRLLHESDSWPEALYNLGSGGSWLAWANDTAAHYAAIHCPHQWTTGPMVCS